MRSQWNRFVLALSVSTAAVVGSAWTVMAAVSFTASTIGPPPTAAEPVAVAVGELDGDVNGYEDLAVVHKKSNTLRILAGNGEGDFATIVADITVGANPLSVALGDCDGDGDDDIFVANSGGTNNVTIIENGATGFSVVQSVAVAGGAFYVAAGDLTGEGDLDLAVALRAKDQVATLEGDGTCNFTVLQADVEGKNAPEGIALGDFDGDFDLDLAVAAFIQDSVVILLNDGTGLFTAKGGTCVDSPNPLVAAPNCGFYDAGDGTSSVAVSDLDGDTILDLALTGANNGTQTDSEGFYVLFGNANGTFGSTNPFGTFGKTPQQVVVGDFNGDSLLDAATANKAGDDVSSFVGSTSPAPFTFVDDPSQPGSEDTFPAGNGPEGIAAGQFNSNQDSDLDLVVANKVSNDVTICLGNGDGTFDCSTPGNGTSEFGSGPQGIAVADFGSGTGATPDGDEDVVVVYEGSDELQIFLGDGSGTAFEALFSAPLDLSADTKNPHDVLALLANSGSDVDIAIAGCGGSGTGKDKVIIVSDRDFSSGKQVLGHGSMNCPDALASGDFDGDSAPDLVVANYISDNVAVLLNNGSGSFAVSTPLASGDGATDVAVGDFGSGMSSRSPDGDLDFVVVHEKADTIRVFFGDGAGGFAAGNAVTVVVNGDPSGVAAVDADGDGFTDVVVSNSNTSALGESQGVAVLLRTTTGFNNAVPFTTASAPAGAVAEDVSGDTAGIPDLVVVNEGSSNVSVLEGRGSDPTLFELPFNVTVDTGPRDVATGDLNGDGARDLATANHTADTVTVLLNTSPVCGDSVTTAPEQCDPPGPIPDCTAVCGPTCRVELP